MKKVLIISPHFPPSNAADMHRTRISLPFFKKYGWDAELVCVEDAHSGIPKDPLLVKSIPDGTKVHYVRALDKKWTSMIGLGSLALRSMFFYKKKVNQILSSGKYDLIYFSTTQFPVCILGAYWKKKFNIPYVIDMQDQWHSNYYRDKPRNERPAKYWFSYYLHKYLEPIAMNKVDGLISVSQDYINILQARYPRLHEIPTALITFGYWEDDLVIAEKNNVRSVIEKNENFVDLVYVGRGGYDMHRSVSLLFSALKLGLQKQPGLFSKLHCYFIGTSYAIHGKYTIKPLADEMGLSDQVTEITDRIGYYESLVTLQNAHALFIPGSDDPNYSASKLYPYLTSKKPILAIFDENSNAVDALRSFSDITPLTLNMAADDIITKVYQQLEGWLNRKYVVPKLTETFKEYSAEFIAGKQGSLFNKVVGE